jgi:hypothetical protein
MNALVHHCTPVNRDAAFILRPSTLQGQPSVPIEQQGAISKCPYCGGRAYRGGWCFGCGASLPKVALRCGKAGTDCE